MPGASRAGDAGKRGVALSPQQWAQVRSAYEGGEPVQDLLTRWGVTQGALYYRVREHGWGRRREPGAVTVRNTARWKASVMHRLMRAADHLAGAFANDVAAALADTPADEIHAAAPAEGAPAQPEGTGTHDGAFRAQPDAEGPEPKPRSEAPRKPKRPEPVTLDRQIAALQTLVRSVQAIDKLRHADKPGTKPAAGNKDDGDADDGLARMRAELERRLDRLAARTAPPAAGDDDAQGTGGAP